MDESPQGIPQENFQQGMSSKKLMAIIIAAVLVTAVAVWWYMQPSAGVAVTTPEQAANTSVDVAKTAADIGSSLDGIQETLSPS